MTIELDNFIGVITDGFGPKAGLFGYQLGAATKTGWQPLVVVPPSFATFPEAVRAAEKDHARVKKILQRHRKRTFAEVKKFSSGDGPTAA